VDTEAKREALMLPRLVDVTQEALVRQSHHVEMRVLDARRRPVTIRVIAWRCLRRGRRNRHHCYCRRGNYGYQEPAHLCSSCE